VVRAKGLEPPRPKPPEPKSGVSTNSTTPAARNKMVFTADLSIRRSRPPAAPEQSIYRKRNGRDTSLCAAFQITIKAYIEAEGARSMRNLNNFVGNSHRSS